MGIGTLSSGGRYDGFGRPVTSPTTVAPTQKPKPQDPNPNKFVIMDKYRAPHCWVVRVCYPGCTNFDGEKVLVIGSNSPPENLRVLDPHFLEDNDVIARFRPDDKGWNRAIEFAKTVT